MAGICSVHQRKHPDCDLCNTHPRDIFPNYDIKLAKAKAMGEHTCKKCGFVFFLKVNFCPRCNQMVKTDSTLLIRVASVHPKLANDLLGFLGEWAVNNDFDQPRLTMRKDGSFDLRVGSSQSDESAASPRDATDK